MKRALLLLALMCLLIATPMLAAAYEPTNVIALDDTAYAIKTIEKEEVVNLIAVDEKAALPAVPIPADEPESLMNVTGLECVYTKYGWFVEQDVDRVSSRFT